MSSDTIARSQTATQPTRRRDPIGRVVAASLLTGVLLTGVLTLLVFPGADEAVFTGSVLTSWGIGWGLLWWLSAHRTNQPQPWALVPAAAMGTTGLVYLLVRPGAGWLSASGWMWPVLVAALVVWMIRESRRSLRSWARPVLLYPVFTALALCAVGSAYEKVAETGDATRLATPGHRFDVG